MESGNKAEEIVTHSGPNRVSFLLAALTVLIPLRPLCAQEKADKSYRLSYFSDLAYSYNAYSFNYVSVRSSPPGIASFYGGGRICGGMGIRAEFNFRSRAYMMISGSIIDKGNRVIYEWNGDNGEYFRQGQRYREFYASVPCEIVFRLKGKPNSVYLKGGICLDTRLEWGPGFAGFAAGCILGFGKSFVINDVLRVSLEPTFRYGICDYGEYIWFFEGQNNPYRPVSFGIVLVLTQLEPGE